MKIFIYVMDQIGPQNACIGLAQELLKRNHRVSFISDHKFASKYQRYGFGHLPLVDPGQSPFSSAKDTEIGDTNTSVQNLIITELFSDRTPLEKLKLMQNNSYTVLAEHCARLEPILKEMLHRERPDLLIVDGPLLPPILTNCPDIPWIKVYCSNPLGLFMTKELPPFLSGLPTGSNQTLWKEFHTEAEKCHYSLKRECQFKLNHRFHYPPPEDHQHFARSKLLNIYQYPEELDYQDLYRIPDNMQRVDAFCREEILEQRYQLPEKFCSKIKPGDILIYVSMGTIGSLDTELMKRLVSALGKTPHWYIVSCGVNHDKFDLAENMTGDIYLPQTKILPLVDMAIIHGGNNSLTEAIYFGKPVLVLPIFYDQFDNAQRVVEKRVGRRLNTSRFTEKELIETVDEILEDKQLSQRLEQISKRIQSSNSKAKACERIEKVVAEFQETKKNKLKNKLETLNNNLEQLGLISDPISNGS